MAAANTAPLVFDLPDGDHAELYTWEGIVYKLTDFMNRLSTAEETVNESLLQIEAKIDTWIEDQS